MSKKEKERWEYFAANNPYHTVVTLEKYKTENLAESLRDEFFSDGALYLEKVWQEIEVNFGQFSPSRVLDFGCGVGRVVIPFTTRTTTVTGVDISENMLEEAKHNCQIRNIENVNFFQTDEFFRNDNLKFDLIHSAMVFQHIKPVLGMQMLKTLIERLENHGIAVLHFTYLHTKGWLKSLQLSAYRDIPFLYKIKGILQRRNIEPFYPIYTYNLNAIMAVLQENDCHRCMVRFSQHGFNGVLLFFQKRKVDLF